jgi:3-deoxy-D-manno-octulosonic-acid transferase
MRRVVAGAGIPQILVNARMSERSFRGWHRFGGMARSLFARIGLCLARTDEDGARYQALGVRQIVVTGDLKFDVPAPAADPADVAAFQALVGNRPVWVAASTHEGEEEIVAAAHQLLRQRHPGLVTIIVPRHPNRGAAIRAALAARGLAVAQRSAGEPIGPLLDIYVADTLGELGLFYRVAPVAFLGGSLVPHGGQNPIEPARLDAAILHGPHVHNFETIYGVLDKAGAAEQVVDAEGLGKAVGAFLDDAAAVRRRVKAATAALAPLSGALDATALALAPYLSAPAAGAGRP